MYNTNDAEERRRDEAQQRAAAAVIQSRWRLYQRRKAAEHHHLLARAAFGDVQTSSVFDEEGGGGAGASLLHSAAGMGVGSADATEDLMDNRRAPDEERQACIIEYQALLAEREALLERNLNYQQILARHYAEQRHRNGDEDITQLTTPDAETAYWALVRQVGEERQRVSVRSAALQRDLEQQRQRYHPIMEEAQMREHNFQAWIQELAASVRFMRSNRPIPTAAIHEYVERETAERAAIRAARVRYFQLKNRLLLLHRAAKGRGGNVGSGAAVGNQTGSSGLSSSSPASATAAGAAATAGDGMEMTAATYHVFLIDFEQLKVENTSLSEKIEERSEEVLKLRHKATNTIHIATHVREKLGCVRQENAELRQHVASTDEELSGARDQLAKSKRCRDAHLRANTRMKERMPLVGSRDLLLDYERRKTAIHDYRTRLVQLSDRHTELTDLIRHQEATMVSLQRELSHYPQ